MAGAASTSCEARSASSAQHIVLTDLHRYRQLSESLFAALRAGRPEAHSLVKNLLDLEERMHGGVRVRLAERERCSRASQAEAAADERLAALLRLATQRQRTEATLDAAIGRSHEAIAASERAAARPLSVSEVVECAERVSYSNAAPYGQSALEAAARGGFRGGWGTPAPQQHMVKASVFAALQRQGAGGGLGVGDATQPSDRPAEGAAAKPEARQAAAPAFDSAGLALAARNAVAPKQGGEASKALPAVSLDLLDDDDL